ncbi:MAG: (2Fe-2S)-binding protein [Firmicutes bacterium]|nr:(2Fe-2S)-binding protein [Bacillota bacterium]
MELVSFEVNGKPLEIAVEKNWTLLKVLREQLDLTGAKPGCETGDCGACKVLLDGKAVNSCTTNIMKVQGRSVITIEGLSKGTELHPIQSSFIEAGAVQCGYCTPGMIITAKSLLDENPHPTEQEIRDSLDNNLCRCTGYVKIVDAIQLAAKKMEES